MRAGTEAPDMDANAALADPEWIAAHLDDPSVRLVELDVGPAAYAAGHIPGAVLWDAYADLRQADYRIISKDQLASLIRAAGIGPETTVVTYGYASHLGYWLLRSIGHDRVRVMDGSRERWSATGHDWSTEVSRPVPSAYEVAGQTAFIADRGHVRAITGGGAGTLVDVRSEGEYTGARFWPSGTPEPRGRPGHVPGAVFLPIDALRTSDGAFRSEVEMRRVVAEAGLAPSEPIVTYCTIGNRAAQAWFALTELLGFEDVRVFYESWVEWGMDRSMPVEV